jgi:hypothetical protein
VTHPPLKLASVIRNHISATQKRAAILLRVRKAIRTFQRDSKQSRAPSSRRDTLAMIAAQSGKLATLLKSLDARAATALTPTSKIAWPTDIAKTLTDLQKRAKRAHGSLAHINRRAPKNVPYHDLLVNLTTAWRRENPKRDGVTKRGATGEYGGPLLKFVGDVLASAKIGERDLGRRLYKLEG